MFNVDYQISLAILPNSRFQSLVDGVLPEERAERKAGKQLLSPIRTQARVPPGPCKLPAAAKTPQSPHVDTCYRSRPARCHENRQALA